MLKRLRVVGVLAVLSLFVQPVATAGEKKLVGWTAQEVGKVFDTIRDMKWHPVAVKGYASGNESLLDITWETTEFAKGWYIYNDIKADVFAQRKTEMDQQGYRLVTSHSWTVGGEERFSAIWYQR